MSKVGLIISREYSTRVKKKSFIVMTVLVPILAIGFLIAAVYLGMPKEKDLQILVVDDSPLRVSRFLSNPKDVDKVINAKYTEKTQFIDQDKTKNEHYYFTAFDTSGTKSYEEALNYFKKSDKFDLLLYLPPTIDNKNPSKLNYKDPPSSVTEKNIYNMVNNIVEKGRIEISNITEKEYNFIKARVPVQSVDVDGKDNQISAKAGVGLAFGIFIYMFIFMYGVQVMKGVIEEKSSRIVEVIVSSVKPFELMMGKIVGIMFVGLTQLALWIIMIGLFAIVAIPFLSPDKFDPQFQSTLTESMMTDGVSNVVTENSPVMVIQDNPMLNSMMEMPWGSLVGLFLFYFIGGYLLYGSLMAAIGAAVDSETDTQQFMLPVSMPLMFAYIISILGISNPNSTVLNWCSEIPFTSPIVMLVRFASNNGEGLGWQVALSMVLLIITFIATTWVAAKIYRVGILMYGKKVTYKELFKWLKY